MIAAFFSHSASQSSQSDAPDIGWQCVALTPQLCANLHAEWAELAEASSEPNIFQFPAYVANSLPLLAEQSARLVLIRDRGLLIGIVIASLDTGYAKLPIPYWRSALHYEQFLGTPLVREGYEDRFATGLCAWLDHAPLDCSFLKLSMIGVDGPIAKAIARHCSHDQRQIFASNRFERAAIACRGHSSINPEDLLGSSRRKSIRKAVKRLAKQGTVSVECLKDPAQFEGWTEHFLALENTGWKRDQGSSILSCQHETQLYRAIMSEAFRAQNLHFSRLCLNGQPIAYTLDIIASPIAYCLKSAIDQHYRKFSPGVLMEYETLKHYLAAKDMVFVDSCSAPDNAMLNELWPNRQAIMDLAVERKGTFYSMIFRTVKAIKMLLKTAGQV